MHLPLPVEPQRRPPLEAACAMMASLLLHRQLVRPGTVKDIAATVRLSEIECIHGVEV